MSTEESEQVVSVRIKETGNRVTLQVKYKWEEFGVGNAISMKRACLPAS